MSQQPHKRLYTVSGIDDDGDVQAFATDDRKAAADVCEQMEQDLSDVRFYDAGAAKAGNDG
jgi:6-phosphogluconolactonase (cycloisomerase 2 family)